MKRNLFLSLLCCLIAATCSYTQVNAQIITTIAGDGTAAFAGDGGLAVVAEVNRPFNVMADSRGNVFICDFDNNRIRKIDAAGNIRTIAGTGFGGTGAGDGGPATAAQLFEPSAIVEDKIGNLIICDYGENRIRKVDTFGIMSTIAGIGGSAAFSGDGGPATNAQLSLPYGVALDKYGNVYISDQGNYRIRKVDTFGIISTIAGNGTYGYTDGGGIATAAAMRDPIGIAIDTAGNIYVAEDPNYIIRKITPDGMISTYAGVGSTGLGGDGGPATSAHLGNPFGVSVDLAGNVYVADRGADKIRKIGTDGIINAVAGNGTGGYSGDYVAPTLTELFAPTGVYVTPDGHKMYIADIENNRVRLVACAVAPITGLSTTVCAGTTLTLTDDTTGGKWMSSDTSVATIDSVAGTLTLTHQGAILISYSDSTNCGMVMVTNYVTVDPAPYAGGITGDDSACPGYTVTLADTIAGGTWISKHSAIATISGTGVVSAVATGLDTVYYIVNNTCGADTASFVFRTLDMEGHCYINGVATRKNVNDDMAIQVTPNPFTEQLHLVVTTTNTTMVNIYLYDLTGRAVAQKINAATNIDMILEKDLPSGMYILEVNNGTTTKRMKVVKE